MKRVPETYPLECALIDNPKTITGYLRKNFWQFFGWGFILFCLFYVITTAGFNVFAPVQLQMLTNLLTGPRPNFWQSAAVTLGIIFLVRIFFRLAEMAANMFWQRIRPRSRKQITADLINYLHCQSMDFINKKMLGKMSQQANNIASNGLLIMQKIFAFMAADLISVAVALTLVIRLHWTIGTLIVCGIVVRAIWFRLNFRNMNVTYRRMAQSVSQINGATTDSISNGANVRAFSGRKIELNIIAKVFGGYRARFGRHYLADRKYWLPTGFLDDYILIAVLFLCVVYFQNGTMTLGDVVFTVGAHAAIRSSVRSLIDRCSDLFETGTETAQNYRELVAKISVHDRENARQLIPERGALSFDAVDFKYERNAPMVLKKLSFDIHAREHVGIVGMSGCGKSTIFKLLMRMYDVTGGAVIIDGQNIADVSLDSLRKSIAFIPQDTSLFNRTILDNLRYAAPRATMADVVHAAKFAGAHDFIMEMPEGYKTIVGDRGVKLSGGQRQRIAIARAFLQQAPILLIDEATSALDSETEEIIQNSIYKIAHEKTMIVVAHRLSTLMKMDRIIVIHNGRIIETGTHEELLKKRGGKYAHLWQCQQCGFIGRDDTNA